MKMSSEEINQKMEFSKKRKELHEGAEVSLIQKNIKVPETSSSDNDNNTESKKKKKYPSKKKQKVMEPFELNKAMNLVSSDVDKDTSKTTSQNICQSSTLSSPSSPSPDYHFPPPPPPPTLPPTITTSSSSIILNSLVNQGTSESAKFAILTLLGRK